MIKETHILLLTLLLGGCSAESQANPVQVSFLNTEESLTNTLSILEESGVPNNAVRAFAKAVHHYNKTPLNIDLSNFPEPMNGFYWFKSSKSFTKALPHRLNETQHPFDVNCFFVTLALSTLDTGIKLNDLGHPLMAFVNEGGNRWRVRTVATPQEAYDASYGSRYPEKIETLTGLKLTDAQRCLDACLHSINVIPRGTEEKHLPEILLATLKARWAQLEIDFPKNMIITMLHAVDATKSCRIMTDHTGLLIPAQSGYMYLEKAGGCGPFLRMDISDISELATYYKTFVTQESKGDMTHYLMTLNDEEICEIYP